MKNFIEKIEELDVSNLSTEDKINSLYIFLLEREVEHDVIFKLLNIFVNHELNTIVSAKMIAYIETLRKKYEDLEG